MAIFGGTVLIAVAATNNRIAQAAELPCLQAGTAGLVRIQIIKSNLVGTDTQSVSWRVGMGLQGVDSGAVAVVQDTLVCTTVTRVVDSALGVPPTISADLLVVRAGPRYIAFEPDGPSTFFLDTNFVFKGVVP